MSLLTSLGGNMKVGSITVPTPTRSAAGKRREKGRKKKSIKDFLYAVPFQHRRTAPVTSNSVPLPSQISIFRKILRVSLSIPKSTGKFYLTGYKKCVWQFLERRSYYRFLRDNIRNQITHGIRLYIKNIEIFLKKELGAVGKKKNLLTLIQSWAGLDIWPVSFLHRQILCLSPSVAFRFVLGVPIDRVRVGS